MGEKSTTILVKSVKPKPTKKQETMESIDELMIRRTLDLAMQARQYGNHPFGSLIYDPETQQVIAEAQNTVHTDCNSTGHAELNL